MHPKITDTFHLLLKSVILSLWKCYLKFCRYYSNQDHLSELGNLDISKYVAASVVVFDLDTKQIKWTAELDLSTDTSAYRSYMYSSPSVVDLDGDGNLDILVGTSYGYFYVIDHKGELEKVWACFYLLLVFIPFLCQNTGRPNSWNPENSD